ncbi:hypothetical protein HK099_007743 [Clydaea vesicula]|uniref:BHLH domain-containing protein n=1 Tax=Clydaea vesicula TaxID=447962 RepID=A0AAD5U8W5_9FUNG|nr:hypothetical protein HK099_007743 [Clydaea vesicula]KAJ3393482.1 hypothetical protein HDU92_007678 [Lobulomyces angularis]
MSAEFFDSATLPESDKEAKLFNSREHDDFNEFLDFLFNGSLLEIPNQDHSHMHREQRSESPSSTHPDVHRQPPTYVTNQQPQHLLHPLQTTNLPQPHLTQEAPHPVINSTIPSPVLKSPFAVPASDNKSSAESTAMSTTATLKKKTRTLLTVDEKKKNHIRSEQKRRVAIKEGFDTLSKLVPALNNRTDSSKSEVLAKTVEYINLLKKENQILYERTKAENKQ